MGIVVAIGWIILGIVYVLYKGKKNEARKREQDALRDEEKKKINHIMTTLPMPTVSQMQSFIQDLKDSHPRSAEQEKLFERLNMYAVGEESKTVDADDFKKIQAAWVYYSEQGASNSELRQRLFGEQNIAEKRYFDPSVPRGDEPSYTRNYKALEDELRKVGTKISGGWCLYPKFAKQAFKILESGRGFSEETLYPLMLASYVHPKDWLMHWMQDDLLAVRIALIPKMMHTLSQTSMSYKEKMEWLKIEAFQLACLPVIREKRFWKNEDLFSVLLEIYNDLLAKEFSPQASKYSFVMLWYGLNGVGRAVGKEGSFFDYPKYLIQ